MSIEASDERENTVSDGSLIFSFETKIPKNINKKHEREEGERGQLGREEDCVEYSLYY